MREPGTLPVAGFDELLSCGAVLEQWSRAIHAYFNAWEQCPFPRIAEAQLCEQVYGLFCHAVGNWLGREEEEEVRAAGPLAGERLLSSGESQRCLSSGEKGKGKPSVGKAGTCWGTPSAGQPSEHLASLPSAGQAGRLGSSGCYDGRRPP